MAVVSMGTNGRGLGCARALVIATLLLAGCGGGGDEHTSTKGTTATTALADAGATTTEAGSDTVAAGSSGATTTSGAARPSSSGAAAPTTTAAVRNVPDATPGIPGAGGYGYHVSGTSKFGANPEQTINMDTTTTVVHLGGGKVRQTSDDQDSVLEWTGSQVLLHSMDLTRPGFERHFEANPPVQLAPDPLKVGQSWGWKLTATDVPTTVQQDSRVDRLETITVSGKTVKAIVVVTKVTISGDVSGTIDLTQWVDTANGLPTRIHAKTNIVTFAFTSDTISDLTGFTPA